MGAGNWPCRRKKKKEMRKWGEGAGRMERGQEGGGARREEEGKGKEEKKEGL